MEEVLVPITLFICTAAAIFGLRYMTNKERMAMIEKGLDITFNKNQSQPFTALKFGLLLVGSGLGLFLAFALQHWVFTDTVNEKIAAVYFSLIAIFGGLGLFITYLIEKKDSPNG
jgi:lipid-A-disaccharide synthase-like uncharacterized protein